MPHQYYLELRLNRARQMLQRTEQVDHPDRPVLRLFLRSAFSSAYRNFFGVTPRDDRNQRRGAVAGEAAAGLAERG